MRSSLSEQEGSLLGSHRNPFRHGHTTSSESSSSVDETAPTEIEVEKSSPRKPPGKVRWRDLPNKSQLFILALCRLSEPLSNVCVLPYIFYLVRSVLDPEGHANHPDSGPTSGSGNATVAAPAPGHAPGTHGHEIQSPGDSDAAAAALASRISLVSGLLVAAFPLAQMLVSLPWGRLSDRHGRRPSILLGLGLTVLSNACFGLSRSLPGLFVWRTVAGAANGNVALMRTMTAETVKERKYQTRAFLLLPLVFNSGMVVSLALGGILADPRSGFPGLFGQGGILAGMDEWLASHLYALPSLLNAVVLGAVLGIAILGLDETLSGKEGQMDWGLRLGQVLVRVARRVVGRQQQGYQQLNDNEMDADEEKQVDQPHSPTPSSSSSNEPPSPAIPSAVSGNVPNKKAAPSIRSLLTPKLTGALVSFALLPLHNNAFMHLFPLYLSTPPSPAAPSGLSWSGGLGLPSSTIGPWLSIFGVLGILLQLFIYPRLQARMGTLGLFRCATLTFPVTYALTPLLSLLPLQSPVQYVFLAFVSAGQILARTIAIPSTVILLTEAAPEKRVLGTVHGAGNTAAAFSRAVGPAVGGAVYAVGVRMGVVGLVWWVYLAVAAAVASAWAFGYQKVDKSDCEET